MEPIIMCSMVCGYKNNRFFEDIPETVDDQQVD